MKQAYANLSPATGAQNSGICTIRIVPREWPEDFPYEDFSTGKATGSFFFPAGKSLLLLTFTADSYYYEEKAKSNKSGNYFEVTCGGTLNKLDRATQQILESLKMHEFICAVKDRNGKQKLVGNWEHGMRMAIGYKQGNSSGGTEVLTVDLTFECEGQPPFWEE